MARMTVCSVVMKLNGGCSFEYHHLLLVLLGVLWLTQEISKPCYGKLRLSLSLLHALNLKLA